MRALALRLLPRFRVPRFRVAPQLVAVILVVGLAAAMAIEPTRQLIAQRERISGMDTDLRRLQRSNESLQARIDRLNDPDYLEQRARSQIGLVRPGETAYVVMPPGEAAAKAAKKKVVEPPPPPPPGFLESFFNFLGF